MSRLHLPRPASISSALVCVITLLGAPPAMADPTAGDKAAAEALFDQGKDLARQDRWREACPKFADSQKIDPGVGTLLFLGECYERTGRLAGAWATFREAAALARTAGDKRREARAQERFARLEPMLPHLVVRVTNARDPVVRDGDEALAAGTLGVPLPVDPGDHVLHASAPGQKEFTATVHLEKGEQKTIEITFEPDLSNVPVAPATPPSPAAPQPGSAAPPLAAPPVAPASVGDTGARVRPLTWSAFGVGAAGLVVGTIFGAMSLSATSTLKGQCSPQCPTDRSSELANARTQAWVSDAGFGVAVLGGAIGAYWLWQDLGSPTPRTGVAAHPVVAWTDRGAFAGAAGRF